MKLIFDESQLKQRQLSMKRKQAYIDTAVLRYSEPYTPKDSGDMIKSGIRSTKYGSGEVTYTEPYSRKVYYSKIPVGRFNGALRGNYWFERMKADKKKIILEEASNIE